MEPVTSQQLEIKSISLPKSLIKETQQLIPKVDYNKLVVFLLKKYLQEIKKKNLEKKYKAYYSSLTLRDQEDEMDILDDFTFSDSEIERYLEPGEQNVQKG